MKTDAGNDNFSRFEDFYQPFLIDKCAVKGNVTRLGKAVDVILTRHNYPEAVSHLLAEQLVLACMLSGKLDKGGALTLQIKGGDNSPVKFCVADVNEAGDIRGYAELNEGAAAKLSRLKLEGKMPTLQSLLGEKALLAMTFTPANGAQYQGIVSLYADNLSEALSDYFTQSEQLQVAIKMVAGHTVENGKAHWCASGIMLQRLPNEGGTSEHKKEEADLAEDWNRSRMLMETVKDKELLDAELSAPDLLLRLFHEDGVWVYEPRQMHVKCRCSRKKIEEVLATFPEDDIEHMKVDGVISVNCQFCNTTEVFREDDLKKIKETAEKKS